MNTIPKNNTFPSSLLAAVALSLLAGGTAAAGEAGSDLLLGSTAAGGGRLLVDYPFDERPVVQVSASGFPGLFTAADPGFVPALDDPAEGLFALSLGTTLGLEITAIDDNVQLQLGADLLEEEGDTVTIGTHDNVDPELSSLHRHPQFLLTLTGDGPGGFAEGDFSFRIHDEDETYDDSSIHELTLSNGYLPAIDASSATQLACRSAVSKAALRLSLEVGKRVGACFESATRNVAAASPAAAARACTLNPSTPGSLAARLDAALAKALASAEKACGTLSDASSPFTLQAASAHLGMHACRAQEVTGATFKGGLEALEEVLAASFGAGSCTASACSGGPLAGQPCGSASECSVERAREASLPCVKDSSSPE